VYCLPENGVPSPSMENQLSAEEITRITSAAVEGGVRRVRLTGGEPLIRSDIVEIIESLAAIPGMEEISLTTNGMLLEKLAKPMAAAGLNRVNVSLDSLEADKFKRITRGGSLDRVWRGIAAAEEAGLTPVKLNCVVIKGLNDDELLDFARLTISKPWHVRFIELMPVGNENPWGEGFPQIEDRYVSVQEMHSSLSSLNLQPEKANSGDGPARIYSIPGALGKVGFISPLGEHFCSNCNRLRLTADGNLRPCLLLDGEFNLLDSLGKNESLLPLIQKAIDAKPEGHELSVKHYPETRRMAQIGG
jgi:cyclic pyranopterin phosphate synthase